MNLRRWLAVGIGVKRWLLVAFLGLLVLAIGVAHVIRQVTASAEPGGPVMTVLDTLTLQFLPYQLRGLIAGVLGLVLFLLGAYRLVRALVDPFALWDRDQPMVEVIYQKRFLARGPRVVAIGGGTGLSALLRGLKEHTSNLTAVVTVADDGGSSGVLRAELGIPAVGDIRNCVVALADAEPAMGRLLQYRFPGTGPADPTIGTNLAEDGLPPDRGAEALSVGLGGHAVGNLLLAALVALEGGDFEEGVREMNRVLAVRGRVLPATGTALSLHARLRDGTEVEGQSRIARSDAVDRVWVAPADVRACADAVAGDRGGGHDRDRAGKPVHEHPSRVARPRYPRGDRRLWRARSCSRATWPPRPARPAATTSPTISRRWGAMARRAWLTSCWPTTGWTPAHPRAGSASRSGSGGRLPVERVPTSDWSSTTSSTRPTPIATTRPAWRSAVMGIWEREGGHRRRTAATRAVRAS